MKTYRRRLELATLAAVVGRPDLCTAEAFDRIGFAPSLFLHADLRALAVAVQSIVEEHGSLDWVRLGTLSPPLAILAVNLTSAGMLEAEPVPLMDEVADLLAAIGELGGLP